MTYARIITWGIALLACTPTIGTQLVAAQLRYASWLGSPWLRMGRRGLYAPYKVLVWYWQYAWYYPVPFDWAMAAMGVWLIGGAILIAILLKRAGWRRHPAMDSAEWATARDIRRAALFVDRRK